MSFMPSFFNTPKPRRFNYIPMYYDEKKEALEERIREIEKEMGVEHGKTYVPGIRKGSMRRKFDRRQLRREKQSNIRLIVIIIFLFLVAWLMFFR